ncbi:LuxR family transcriptional regulator [Stenotrophomonas acidaminiphila]|uniref:LuxR family transcriptional regulator n=1 Tax=Stenotrophomonas sp. Y6 TaxID=2920383 RepID=UPI001F056273|nr:MULTISPECIES: LuxR family transcriptional regulator [Stenotrophomonas]MCH1908288.1 LuxR family transcriptional regulator [Stenotrophomonas sp. Y6]WPU54964.1 LuxR family transcriptional regulator [Stenotrophomonas acidaminiphila]
MNVMLAALLSTALTATPALAAAPAVPADSPLVGQWLLDVDSLPMPPEARPKRVDLVFAATPDGRWNERVQIVGQDDKVMHAESTLALDGTPGRASGTYWVDVLAAKMPAPNVLVMQFVYEGIPRSTRVYSVSADGNVMTETESYFKDGTPVLRTALFKRAGRAR